MTKFEPENCQEKRFTYVCMIFRYIFQTPKLTEDDEVVLTRIDFFQGLKVAQLSAGKDFTLALVERGPNNHQQQQQQERHVPATVQHSKSPKRTNKLDPLGVSCPLGLPLAQSPKHPPRAEVTTSTPKDPSKEKEEQVELRKKSDHEDRDKRSSESVERLSHTGMYINPTDAIKYLSDQLSWMGKNNATAAAAATAQAEQQQQQEVLQSPTQVSSPPAIPEEVPVGDAPAQANVVSNLYKATSSAMAGGVKYVMGQTGLSRLSQSFSASTDKDDEEVGDGDDGRKAPLVDTVDGEIQV